MIEREPSVKEMAALWNLCADFIEQNNIHCAESVYQSDHVIENACEFIELICKEVGYDTEDDCED